MEFTVEAVAAFLGGEIEGNKEAKLSNVAKIEEAGEGDLAFLSNPKYEEFLYSTAATAVIVSKELSLKQEVSASLIRVEDPYASFAKLLELYVASKPQRTGVSPRASVAEDVVMGEGCYVGDFAVVESGVVLGDNVKIYPQTFVGERVKIGSDSTLFAGVKVYEECVLGEGVTIHSGAVIGADGFGFAPQSDGSYSKIPQIGNVVLGNLVEIGANATIDRATMGSTVIEAGVKIDNLVQVAHNVTIGEHTVIAAQAGIAGSTKIGANVMMGGQVGVVGHINIANGAKILSQSGINHNITKEGEAVIGSPAFPAMSFHRSYAVFKELPALRKQVAELKRELDALRAE